jgi:hypothetical protein
VNKVKMMWHKYWFRYHVESSAIFGHEGEDRKALAHGLKAIEHATKYTNLGGEIDELFGDTSTHETNK